MKNYANFKMRWFYKVVISAGFYLFLTTFSSGCAVNYLAEKLDLNEKFQESKTNVLSSGELSAETVQELRILSLNEPFKKNPEATLVAMEDNHVPGRLNEQAQAFAEAAFFHAEHLYKSGKKIDSAKYYLMAAANAYDFLFHYKDNLAHSFVSPFGRNMTELYNASISKIVSIYQEKNTGWTIPWESTVGSTVYHISASPDFNKQMELSKEDDFLPAYEIKVTGLNNFYSSQGIGAPIVRKIKNDPGKPSYNPFIPKVLSSPITVLFNFSERRSTANGGERDVTVSFLNPYKVETTEIGGANYPLEADFSTAFGVMLSDLKPGALDLDQLLNPEKYIQKIGLKFIQPYDPDKIPVVMVHGLYSSPGTFVQMANDLMGVESIRKHYQFWVFGYPTGLPILNSSTRLRASLLEAQKVFNPDGKNLKFNQMVIIGHSMGGILSRSMILESSQHLYDSFVTVPIDKLDLTPKERAELIESMFFKPLPFISRAIFIASPLRGSEIAQGGFVRKLSRWLISLPKAIVSYRQSVLRKNRKYLNPALNNTDFIDSPVSSVDNLRSDSPLLKAYIETNTVPGVPYHTIIGIQDHKEGPGSDDGIVPYYSSHMDGAESEKLVPGPHTCLTMPQTIAEIRRILFLHLEKPHIK
jgi:hypothetical protein